MMKRLWILLLLAWSAGCRTAPHRLPDAGNLLFARLHGDAAAGIAVIADERKGPIWFRIELEGQLETLEKVPESSMRQIWQIVISPDDRYLAVLSAGEGHPVVDIFALSEILVSNGDLESEDEMVQPLQSLDPFPGTVSIVGWRQNAVLELESDMPLETLDEETRRIAVEDLREWERIFADTERHPFLWEIPSDSIERESP